MANHHHRCPGLQVRRSLGRFTSRLAPIRAAVRATAIGRRRPDYKSARWRSILARHQCGKSNPCMQIWAQRLWRKARSNSSIEVRAETFKPTRSTRNCALCAGQERFCRFIRYGWRPEPESNRRARICNPLRHHSAIGPHAKLPHPYGMGRVLDGAASEGVSQPCQGFARTPVCLLFRGWRHQRCPLCASMRA